MVLNFSTLDMTIKLFFFVRLWTLRLRRGLRFFHLQGARRASRGSNRKARPENLKRACQKTPRCTWNRAKPRKESERAPQKTPKPKLKGEMMHSLFAAVRTPYIFDVPSGGRGHPDTLKSMHDACFSRCQGGPFRLMGHRKYRVCVFLRRPANNGAILYIFARCSLKSKSETGCLLITTKQNLVRA